MGADNTEKCTIDLGELINFITHVTPVECTIDLHRKYNQPSEVEVVNCMTGIHYILKIEQPIPQSYIPTLEGSIKFLESLGYKIAKKE